MNSLSATTITAEVDSLIDQLKRSTEASKKARAEIDPLKKEEVEKFVIEQAGELIKESLDLVKNIKDTVLSAPNGRDIEALAGLITAASSAIETLNKQVIMDRKSETFYKGKEMDAKNRRANLIDETQAKILLTREQMVKELATQTLKQLEEVSGDKVIDVELEPTSCSPDCK
jgi:DNA primase